MNKEVMSTVNKPMSIVKDEFIENLVNLINGNNLPLFVTESILKDLLAEVSVAVKEQAKIERENYEKMLKQKKKELEEDIHDRIDDVRE